ncbi:MAG: hypothetical protein WAW41_04950, partial [Methylobacter sp.]
LFFGYFLFDCMDAGGRAMQGAIAEAEQKKVTRLRGRDPDSNNRRVSDSLYIIQSANCVTSVTDLFRGFRAFRGLTAVFRLNPLPEKNQLSIPNGLGLESQSCGSLRLRRRVPCEA